MFYYRKSHFFIQKGQFLTKRNILEDLLFFNFNEKSSVLLIFFFNASLFSFLLFKSSIKEEEQSSKWLAVFLLLGAFYICPFMFGYANWYSVKSYREFLYFVPFQQLFLLGPVFYFYVQSLLNRSFRLNKRNALHLIPATLYFIFSLKQILNIHSKQIETHRKPCNSF